MKLKKPLTLLFSMLSIQAFAVPGAVVSSEAEILSLDDPIHEKAWDARWIWSDDTSLNTNVLFRKAFHLDSSAARAPTRICSDTAYLLYVNGIKVLRGPLNRTPKGEPSNYYDHIDLAPFLKKGENLIAVRAYHFGHTVKWYVTPEMPGFIFQMDLPGTMVTSDSSWSVQTAGAWDSDSPFRSTVGFNSEVFDAGKLDPSWSQPGFDARTWSSATELGSVPEEPWGTMVKRPIPYFLEIDSAEPQEIVSLGQSILSDEWEPHARIRAQELEPLGDCSIEKLDDSRIVPLEIQSSPGKAAVFVVDFGGLVTGRPYFVVEGGEGVEIDIFYSGRFNPDKGQLDAIPGDRYVGREKNADRIITRQGKTSWEGFDFRAFRYMEFHVRNALEPIKLEDLSVRIQRFDFPVEASVRTSDAFVNRLYDVSKETIRHCSHDVFMDGPERERAGWLGDAAMQMVFAWYTFGDLGENSLTEKVLQQTVWHPTPGQKGRYSHHPPQGHLLLPGQLMWLFQRVWPYYLHSGREEFVEDMYPHMQDVANYFGERLDRRGIIDASFQGMELTGGYWCWIDWADVAKTPRSPDEPDVGAILILNAQYKMLLDDLVSVSELVGTDSEQEHWKRKRDAFIEAFDPDIWWNEKRGCFVDAEKEGAAIVSQQANAMAILSGLASDTQRAMIAENVFGDIRQTESKTVERGGAHEIGECSPFSISYVIPALFEVDRADLALGLMRDKFKYLNTPWLNSTPEYWWLNAPTGGFSNSRGASMCHGWGASPSYFLPALFAGITPVEPAFSTFRFAPVPTDIEEMEASVPTPKGMIKGRVELKKTWMEMTLDAPAHTQALVEVPTQYLTGRFAPRIDSISINGDLVWRDGQALSMPAGVHFEGDGGNSVVFRVDSGDWTFRSEL